MLRQEKNYYCETCEGTVNDEKCLKCIEGFHLYFYVCVKSTRNLLSSINGDKFYTSKYIKQIKKSLIIEGCKLNADNLDNKGDKVGLWSTEEKRGGMDYFPPKGWIAFGINVKDKYDNGDNDWLADDGNKNEWAVAYHGIRTKLSITLEEAVNSIITSGEFKTTNSQEYYDDEDVNHNGKKVGKGVYCSPNPNVMELYAKDSKSTTIINGKAYMIGLMLRVKPDKIRIPKKNKDYWVLKGTSDEIRPYRILVKENEC